MIVVWRGPGDRTRRTVGREAFTLDRGIPTWVPGSMRGDPGLADLEEWQEGAKGNPGRPILAILPVRPDMVEWTVVGLSVLAYLRRKGYPLSPLIVRCNPWLVPLVMDSGIPLRIDNPRMPERDTYRELALTPEVHPESCAGPLLAAHSMGAALLEAVHHRNGREEVPGLVAKAAGSRRVAGQSHLVIIHGANDQVPFRALGDALGNLRDRFARVSEVRTVAPTEEGIRGLCDLLKSADYAIALAPSRVAHVAAYYGVPLTLCFVNGYGNPAHHFRPWPGILLAGRDLDTREVAPYLDAVTKHVRQTTGIA